MKLELNDSQTLPIIQVGRYLVPLVILGLAVHLLVPQLSSLEHSMQVLQTMAVWAVFLAIIAQILSYFGSGYLLKSIVQLSGDHFSLGKATAIILASASLGMVAGGMVGIAAATYRWTKKAGAKPETAGLAGTIPGFFNITVMVLVSTAGLLHLLLIHELSRLQVLSFVLLLGFLLAITVLFVWGFRHRIALEKMGHRLAGWWFALRKREYHAEKMDSWLEGLFNTWDILINGGWRGPALGASLYLFFDMLTLYFVFLAVGYPVAPGVLLTGYGLPLLLGRLAFIIPGGVGVIEGTMVALYDGLGVPDPVTVVVVLGYRIISFWLPLLLGFPLIIWLQHDKSSEISA